MRRILSYRDAVRLLGDGQSPAVAWLDRAASTAMLAAAPGSAAVLGWFDAKSDLVRHGHDLVTGLSERLRGLHRFDRTQRLEAAHAIIVTTAFLTACADLPLPTEDRPSRSFEQAVRELLTAPLPLPSPEHPYEHNLATLHGHYRVRAALLCDELPRLAIWDTWHETQRDRVTGTLRNTVPDKAIGHYQDLFRQLATDCPELACWANLIDHQATRGTISTGLAALSQRLDQIATGRLPDDRRAELTRRYQARLSRPVLIGGDLPAHLRIPALEKAYVDPVFRAMAAEGRSPAHESEWRKLPDRTDIHDFLTGYLTNPVATQLPLLVLGQPGSGKSMLTSVLAARLPATDFLPVRVPLRDVAAESDIQSQIEQAIRADTGESLSWPTFSRSAGDALPVVLLDGFDELLQTTGVSQSNYLEKVQEFQERESDTGRPVAVLITTRTSVADRARIPDGCVALRLEPFDEPRVSTWLDTWNTANTGPGFTALPAEVALHHPDLATQPLLLLMLALYHSEGGALTAEAGLSQSELYERLLLRFARREVVKTQNSLPDKEIRRSIEEELRRLSVVAYGMFNRGTQWITEADLESDLAALPGPPRTPVAPQSLQADLTEAEQTLGRFFFIHRAEASRDDRRLRTYEFLHATFGEYLVARFTWKVLQGLVAQEKAIADDPYSTTEVNDDLLHALISFEPLSSRKPVISFLSELAACLDKSSQVATFALLGRLFQTAHHERAPRRHAAYLPNRHSVPTRHAAYSANLMLLNVIVAGKVEVTAYRSWYYESRLWHAQLEHSAWRSLTDTIAPTYVLSPSGRQTWLRLAEPDEVPPAVDLDQLCRADHSSAHVYSYDDESGPEILRRYHFLGRSPMLVHAIEPLLHHLGDMINFASCVNGIVEPSPARRIMDLWLLSARQIPLPDRIALYQHALDFLAGAACKLLSGSEQEQYLTFILERLAADTALDSAALGELLTRAGKHLGSSSPIYRRCARILDDLRSEG
ncbi:NACHT domain-containing protein [Crossiella sp. CA198]|uniref:NACHT domain-containing protein n=1 Tax=Crossiella sp. CA198 TaxID=3455607 RepID=UPI003F8CF763